MENENKNKEAWADAEATLEEARKEARKAAKAAAARAGVVTVIKMNAWESARAELEVMIGKYKVAKLESEK